MNGKSDWKQLIAIFAVALLVRMLAVGWFEIRPASPLPDEETYLGLADDITFEGAFRMHEPAWRPLVESLHKDMQQKKAMLQMGEQRLLLEDFPGVQRYMQHEPMYPLVIAAVMRATNQKDAVEAVRTMRVLQAFMGAISAMLVFLVASHFFDGRGRAWAGWIAALYPPWVYATGLMLTETMFIMLLLVCWYLAMRILEKPTPTDVLMCGLFASAAVLTKGSSLGLFVVLAPVLVISSPRKLGALAAAAALLVIIAIGISPWVARNYQITRLQNQETGISDRGNVVITTCSVGKSLYEATGPEANGGPGMERIKVPTLLGTMTEREVDEYYYKEAVSAIRKNPGRFLKLAAVKFARTWSATPNYQGYRKPIYMAVTAASVIPVVVLGVWGWWLARRRVREWVVLLLPVAYFTMLHMVFVGSVRYREPVMGFLMVLAGVALAGLLKTKQQKLEEMETGQ